MPTPAVLIVTILFSLIGMGVFMYAKRLALVRLMVLGVALMVYPYFVDTVGLLWLIGALLCVAVYYFRE